MTLEDLIGKTIENTERIKYKKYDDEFVKLTFTDGTSCILYGGYGYWTGESLDEYNTFVGIEDNLKKVIQKISYADSWEEEEFDDDSTFEDDTE